MDGETVEAVSGVPKYVRFPYLPGITRKMKVIFKRDDLRLGCFQPLSLKGVFLTLRQRHHIFCVVRWSMMWSVSNAASIT